MARKLASFLKAGDIISLTGDLGAGKTVFVQRLAKGLGIKNRITSPTFNLIKEYKGKIPLYHFDIYRLENLSELINLGYEEYFYGQGITVIEWGDKIRPLLGSEYLEIEFKLKTKMNERIIHISTYGHIWEERVKRWLRK